MIWDIVFLQRCAAFTGSCCVNVKSFCFSLSVITVNKVFGFLTVVWTKEATCRCFPLGWLLEIVMSTANNKTSDLMTKCFLGAGLHLFGAPPSKITMQLPRDFWFAGGGEALVWARWCIVFPEFVPSSCSCTSMCLHITTLHFINILHLYTWTGIHLYASTVTV